MKHASVRIHLPEPSGAARGSRSDVGRVQAWAVGLGHGHRRRGGAAAPAVLATSLPVLIDADGLTVLARHRELLPRPAPTLITPHAGELGRLLDVDPADIEARRLEYARRAADQARRVRAAQGLHHGDRAAGRRGPVLVNTTGTPWLATAGTGDVLAGLAGALLAQGLLPPQAAIAAAYLHGLAARLAAAGDASFAAHGGAGDAQPRGTHRRRRRGAGDPAGVPCAVTQPAPRSARATTAPRACPAPSMMCMLRPESWSRLTGESPVRVGTGAPGSRPRFVVERRRAERGVESLFGGSKRAGRSVKRTLQPRQMYNGGAEPLMSRRRPCPAGPVPGSACVGSSRGTEGGTRAKSGPEQERPVCLACVGQGPLV